MGKQQTLLDGKRHIHMIGIGGSGMFPIAQILHAKGYQVTGSDNNPSDTLELVKALGIPVEMGQRAENIQGADLIIHTAAIMADNPELIAARASGIPTVERSIILGELTRWYENALCVCGTHGKTTTSCMLAQILLDAGMDPTAVIGGKLPAMGGNGRVGQSGLMVCEACEFVDTFLQLAPDTTVVLNIDEDHMDYFKTMENLVASFRKFCGMTRKLLILNGEDTEVAKAAKGLPQPRLTFGWGEGNDYYPQNLRRHPGIHTSFDLCFRGETLGEVDVYVPGKHNVLNAVAAAAAAISAGASFEQVRAGLANFRGAGRRFEILGQVDGITVADDYAHHPAELRVTLSAAKQMDFKRVIAVHQPFTYSRTKLLLEDFAEVLQLADQAVLSEIMGSREKNTIGIYSRDLAEKIPGCVWFDTFEEITDYICGMARPGDLILTMGCGDIYKAAKLILKRLKAEYSRHT